MEKIEKYGDHVYMSPEEMDHWYSQVEEEHELYLSTYQVKLPARHTTKALWLIYLRKYLKKAVHKDTIAAFVAQVMPETGRDQQVRHLAADGWYILNRGERIPDSTEKVPSGYHVLYTVESPKPTFMHGYLRRAGRMAAKNFHDLKVLYDFRCATCGSQEGKPHLLERNKTTELQKAHMDPSKPLTIDNTIPQCQVCNGVYQNDYRFNEKGRVVAVASAGPVARANEEVQEQIKELFEAFDL